MRRPKAKKVSYELIARTDDLFGGPMYGLLDELVTAHHADLTKARIALAWCSSWKEDVDGKVVLGKCRKASDLDRELVAFDFILLLAKWFWRSLQVTDAQRRALLDHELCHAAVKCDANGEPMEDERGRIVYRLRKHDIEEFTQIVGPARLLQARPGTVRGSVTPSRGPEVARVCGVRVDAGLALSRR